MLIKCTSCGNEIDSEAISCPKCGAANKELLKKKNKLKYLLMTICIIFAVALIGLINVPKENGNNPQVIATQKIYEERQIAPLKYMEYSAVQSWYQQEIQMPLFIENKKALSSFLCVEIYVKNTDVESRYIKDIFKLVDENGAEYDSATFIIEQSLNYGSDLLNPYVSKQGVVIFDVPKNRQYTLEIRTIWNPKSKVRFKLNPTV